VAPVLAVLGEGCEAEVFLLVVQAVVVDVVHEKVFGCVEDFAVHFDAFTVLFSDGIISFLAIFCEPLVSCESVVVFGIDDGEQALSERYCAWRRVFGVCGA